MSTLGKLHFLKSNKNNTNDEYSKVNILKDNGDLTNFVIVWDFGGTSTQLR